MQAAKAQPLALLRGKPNAVRAAAAPSTEIEQLRGPGAAELAGSGRPSTKAGEGATRVGRLRPPPRGVNEKEPDARRPGPLARRVAVGEARHAGAPPEAR